jgi:hypothetical protein
MQTHSAPTGSTAVQVGNVGAVMRQPLFLFSSFLGVSLVPSVPSKGLPKYDRHDPGVSPIPWGVGGVIG